MPRTLLLLSLLALVSAATHAAGADPMLHQLDDVLRITHEGRSLDVSIRCPIFRFEGSEVGGAAPQQTTGQVAGDGLEVRYATLPVGAAGALEVTLHLKWSPREQVLSKWARYRFTGAGTPPLLQEVVLESLDAGASGARLDGSDWQSHPAFLPGFFTGIEFPVASTRLEGGRLLLAHRPGRHPQPGIWHETRKAVYGVAPMGDERAAFERYLTARRPGGTALHVNYNSWWTSPVPYTEQDILSLMQTFERRLYRPHGVSFDTFCIDMGWSNLKSIWEIDPKLFPEGFTRITAAAQRMNARLGLWISPSSCYPGALDNAWAAEAGFETFTPPGSQQRYACLGGPHYQARFRDRLLDLVRRYHIGHIKFDGYVPECPASDHGHAPGSLSHEALAEGIIDVFQTIRKASPDTWLEPTCFGWNPSPWWLLYVDSVIGTYGDDAPPGRVPAPVYRQSYTTGRDFFNLQGTHHLPIPAMAQEVLGIVHQTTEPFLDDAVMTVMRGHRFLPVYLNPRCMDRNRWQALAGLLRWARTQMPQLRDTRALLPPSWEGDRCPRFVYDVPMPREPYGYIHRTDDGLLVALRNPWIAPATYSLRLNSHSETPPDDGSLTLLSLYPEVRLYGENLRWGQTVSIPLMPYETVVLRLAPRAAPPGVPAAAAALSPRIQASVSRREIERVEFEGPQEAFGPDWTSLVGDMTSGVRVVLEAQVSVQAANAEVLILLEGKAPPHTPFCQLQVDGRDASLAPTGSETGWSATGLPQPEHWLFLRAPLRRGRHTLSLDLLTDGDGARASCWLWATKPGQATRPPLPDALPQPELLSLGSLPLLDAVETASVPGPAVRRPRPMERIDGVFLDAIEPAVVEQGGYGTLQRNRSVWEKPMTIAGRRFSRGLGTHAPSRIVYALGGRYRRFQCWAGADAATTPTVTFTVRVDGKTRWQSGLMQRHDPARRVDLDVRGAQTLELLVGDGGNGVAADHADWADARLLR